MHVQSMYSNKRRQSQFDKRKGKVLGFRRMTAVTSILCCTYVPYVHSYIWAMVTSRITFTS